MGHENLLVTLVETARYPLINGLSDLLTQAQTSFENILAFWRLLNSLEEECLERLERVLVHELNYIELDEQEVQHGALSGNDTVNFSELVDFLFLNDSLGLLALNFVRGLLGLFKTFDKRDVLQNRVGIGIRKILEQFALEFGESDLELVLLCCKLFL